MHVGIEANLKVLYRCCLDFALLSEAIGDGPDNSDPWAAAAAAAAAAGRVKATARVGPRGCGTLVHLAHVPEKRLSYGILWVRYILFEHTLLGFHRNAT